MPVAAIVGAVIAVAGTVVSSAISSSDAEEAQNEARRMYEVDRGDRLRREREANRLNNLSVAQSRLEFKESKRRDRLDRAERERDRQFGRRETQFQKQIGLINANDAMRSNYANVMQRGVR